MSSQKQPIKVAVRCRPRSRLEMQEGSLPIVEIKLKQRELKLRNPRPDSDQLPKSFTFDHIYDSNSTQEKLYDQIAYPIVDSVLEGYNGAIMAYGKSESGKSFTMYGDDDDEKLKGIIPRAFEHIFDRIQETPDKQFLVYASFFEVYEDQVRDLLSNSPDSPLEVTQDSEGEVYIKSLRYFPTENLEKIRQKFNIGRKNSITSVVRSGIIPPQVHQIFTITVESSGLGSDGQIERKIGKLRLVDIGDSERLNKGTFVEEPVLSRSILTLQSVISALADRKAVYVPYNDSKLTRILKDALGGNSKTVIIANFGPADWDYEATLRTLNFAKKAESCQNKVRANVNSKNSMLKELQEEIEHLRSQLESVKNSSVKASFKNDNYIKIEDQEKEVKANGSKEKEADKQAEEQRKIGSDLKNVGEEEKPKSMNELKEKEEIQNNDKEIIENITKRLNKLESKIVIGRQEDEEIVISEKKHRRNLQELEEEEQQLKELRMREALARREADSLIFEGTYGSVKEELDSYKKRLHKFFKKTQEVRAELEDQRDEFRREKRFYESMIREMMIELKLKNVIIESFIPPGEVKKIQERTLWNENLQEWVIPNKNLVGNHSKNKNGNANLSSGSKINDRKVQKDRESHVRTRDNNILTYDFTAHEKAGRKLSENSPQMIHEILNKAIMENDESLLRNDSSWVYFRYTDDGIGRETPANSGEKRRTARPPVSRKMLAVRKISDEVSRSTDGLGSFRKLSNPIKSLDSLSTPVKKAPKVGSVPNIA